MHLNRLHYWAVSFSTKVNKLSSKAPLPLANSCFYNDEFIDILLPMVEKHAVQYSSLVNFGFSPWLIRCRNLQPKAKCISVLLSLIADFLLYIGRELCCKVLLAIHCARDLRTNISKTEDRWWEFAMITCAMLKQTTFVNQHLFNATLRDFLTPQCGHITLTICCII